MSRPLPRAAMRLGMAAALLVACLAVSRAVAGMRAAPEPPRAPSIEFDFDAAMARFSGQLSARAAKELAGLDLAEGDTALVVVITPHDLATCEDLGRQLRDLRRAYGTGKQIAVWGDSTGTGVLESYLRTERIPRVVVSPIPPSAVLSDGSALYTPAAILATREGRIVEGVSHTLKAPNVRLRSFAQELTSLRRPPAADAGGGNP